MRLNLSFLYLSSRVNEWGNRHLYSIPWATSFPSLNHLSVKLLSSPLQQGVSLLPHLYSLPLFSLWKNGDSLFILGYSGTWLNSVKDKEKTFPWASPTISFSPEPLLAVRLINLHLSFLYLYCGWREVFQGKTIDSFNSRVSQERSAHEPTPEPLQQMKGCSLRSSSVFFLLFFDSPFPYGFFHSVNGLVHSVALFLNERDLFSLLFFTLAWMKDERRMILRSSLSVLAFDALFYYLTLNPFILEWNP